MSADTFLDTNILVYALTPGDARSLKAQSLLRDGGTISVQVLNEFTNVAIRKLKRPWSEVTSALVTLRILFPDPLAITVDTHRTAVEIAEQDGLSFYDALIVASALQAGCTSLLSEGMQHGWTIRQSLTIRNPFASA
jgi:predicted nucleic acid-binding protein